MFYNCKSLTSINLTKFNTKLIKDMSNLFYNCNSLRILDITKFNTSQVENMEYICLIIVHLWLH